MYVVIFYVVLVVIFYVCSIGSDILVYIKLAKVVNSISVATNVSTDTSNIGKVVKY